MLVPDMSDSAHVCRKEALTWQTKKPSPALTKYHISGGLTAVPHPKNILLWSSQGIIHASVLLSFASLSIISIVQHDISNI